MPLVDVNSLKIGQVISFQSKDAYDTLTQVGTIKAIGSYDIINTVVLEVLPRYKALKKQYHDMPPLDELEFLVLELVQDSKSVRYAIAKEWIDPSSLQIIEQDKVFKINLYDVDEAQIVEALHVLTRNGFKCARSK